MNLKLSNKFIVISIIVLIIGSFFLGRCTQTVKEVTTISWVPLPQRIDSIDRPYPVEVIVPSDPIYKIKEVYRDTGKVVVIDSSKTIKDWTLKRFYREEFFDNDTVGKLVVESMVQYNQLQYMRSKYNPIQKTVTNTITKEPKFTPYGLIGMNSELYPAAALGAKFSNNLMIQFDLQYDSNYGQNKVNFGVKLGYSF